MREPVVVLAPDRGRQQDVLGCDRGAPRHVVLADVQPLGVLVEHGIDDVGEGFIGVEEPVPPGQQVSLQPAEQRVLRQHLHDAPIDGKLTAVGVLRQHVGHPRLLARLVDGLKPVRGGLVRSKDAEARHVVLHHIAKVLAERLGVLVAARCRVTRRRRRTCESREARDPSAAVRRWRAGWRSCAGTLRRQAFELGHEPAAARRTVPRACSCASSPRGASGSPGCHAHRRTAPGASARTLPPCGP